jgi:type VII secretion-associated serine protease mycosin
MKIISGLGALSRSGVAAAVLGLAAAIAIPIPAFADSTRDSQWHLKALDVEKAQLISQGEGVTVAVVDTGVDATHPDLSGSVMPGIDLTNTGVDGTVDSKGHGTAMAGLIAAHGNDGNGALGISPRAKVLPVRVANTGQLDAKAVLEGIKYATRQGVQVISLSLATGGGSELRQAVSDAIATNIVVVAAAGNLPDDKTLVAPAGYDGVIAVGGSTQNGEHEKTSTTGAGILISAPATDVVSTAPGGKYRAGTGTSDSTAIVSGVVALIRAKYPKLTVKQVTEAITSTAADKGDPGRDSLFGYGIVNPVAALAKAGQVAGGSSASAGSRSGDAVASNSGGNSSRKVLVVSFILIGMLVAISALVLCLILYARRQRRTPPRFR